MPKQATVSLRESKAHASDGSRASSLVPAAHAPWQPQGVEVQLEAGHPR